MQIKGDIKQRVDKCVENILSEFKSMRGETVTKSEVIEAIQKYVSMNSKQLLKQDSSNMKSWVN